MITETDGQYRDGLIALGGRLDPFGSYLDPKQAFTTVDGNRATEAIFRTIEEKNLLAIIAPAGAGKSTMLAGALAGLSADCHVVCPPVLEADKLTIREIQRDLIGTINGKDVDSFPRDAPRRARLTATTLGNTNKKPVVLCIDEAHMLSFSTLSAIKRLWNLPYLGRSPLLSIVLVGQTPLLAKLGELWELGGRTEIIRMAGLTVSEGASYITHRLKCVNAPATMFTEEAKIAVSKLCPTRTPLAINGVCRRAIAVAGALGHKAVTDEDVRSAAGVWDIRVQLLRDAGIDFADIAARAGGGITPAIVRTHLMNGTTTANSGDKKAKVIENALDELLAQKRS